MTAPKGDSGALEPRKIRAVLARRCISPNQLRPWWSPDTEADVDPLNDPETQAEVRGFMAWLWAYCIQVETATRKGSTAVDS